ncbi:NAD(P)-binding Rossmann-fold containing protein [Glarea lozoyensis ATCC 20868]|uniref:NAD(P)-binding Rossmann-fold containing protein n=2 Tax=Glarea lozoyensis TaxID=101852 RepID=S3E1X3_GLAL2|nr:NAD(P)-binding Rossmann-fold containing protein [Glarea lozoyensis ATCC 20868]EHK95984.1 putative Zinc-type alcohol dehydrogenase-like protein [Glarea lozoyensis 74030]EPE32488.1 NAD(P)-binding Rossmann-fold containing protein [Glarea lozoyensis ATCC 20868]
MSKQIVFRLQSRTGYQSIKQVEEAIPTIDKHEVLVKIRAVSLNYRDVVVANGGYPFPVKDQVVPCSDSAGEVIEIGSSVEGFAKGDRVIAVFDPTNLFGPQKDWHHGHGGPVDGVLREYVAFPSSALIKISGASGLNFSQMAALVCTGVTAWNVLYGNQPLKPGHTVLFQGTGGVSITGLILAKAAGATTIITSSSDEKLELVQKKYGADHTVNYKKTPDWASEVNKITEGHGVDYIFENGGSGTIKQSIDCIAMGGIISVVGFLSAAKQEDMPDVAGLALSKGAVVRGITVGSKQLLEELVRFVLKKKLSVPVEKEFGFSAKDVQAAFDYLVGGSHIGKVCIVME